MLSARCAKRADRGELLVEPLDDFGRCLLGRADAEPDAGLVSWQEFSTVPVKTRCYRIATLTAGSRQSADMSSARMPKAPKIKVRSCGACTGPGTLLSTRGKCLSPATRRSSC